MKKKVLIISAIVVVLIVAIAGITFAAWDNTSQYANLTATVGGNINLKVEVSDGDGKSLVPEGARNFDPANQVELLTVGKFVVSNAATNGIPANEYNMKVVWTLEKVESKLPADEAMTEYNIEDFHNIFDIYLFNNGSRVELAGEVALGTEYPVVIKFKQSANDIISPAELSGRTFNITIKLEAIARS